MQVAVDTSHNIGPPRRERIVAGSVRSRQAVKFDIVCKQLANNVESLSRLERSLMYNRKRVGPDILPSGTPET